MQNNFDYDILVAGGGMVGALFAALAAQHGYRIGVLEAYEPQAYKPSQEYDLRVSAISVGSERLLKSVGIWQLLMSWRHCPYRHMRVYDQTLKHQTHFDSAELAEPHLGHIIENRLLQLALKEALTQHESVDWLCPIKIDQVRNTLNAAVVKTSDGRTLRARLLVAADGANSAVRNAVGIQTRDNDYKQSALVVSVATAYPQQDVTWQRFTPTGPQAFLPLSGANGSLVWYHNPDEVARLKELPKDELLDILMTQFPSLLGELEGIHGVASFPIKRKHAETYVQGRVVLMGDAAHAVHPLAGQGVNIGFLDAAALAQKLGCLNKTDDLNHPRTLASYERWRKSENTQMIAILEAFHHGFSGQSLMRQKAAGFGLSIANNAGVLKQQVMKYAMGTEGHLPDLIRYPQSD